MTAPICKEKASLVATYEEATRAHSEKLADLMRTMGTSSKEQYEAHYRMTEALRDEARMAREALEQHVKEHGC